MEQSTNTISDETSKSLLISLLMIVIVWLLNGIYLSSLSHYSALAFWIADIFQWIVLPSTIIWNLSIKNGMRPKDIGLDITHINFTSILITGLVTFSLYITFFSVAHISWLLLGKPSGFFSFTDVFPNGVLGDAVWIYSALTAGIVESIFFIGLPWLLWSHHKIGGYVSFTIISSFVFACAHWEQGFHAVAAAFAFGVVACSWYLRLKTLWPVVIGHVIIVLIAFG